MNKQIKSKLGKKNVLYMFFEHQESEMSEIPQAKVTTQGTDLRKVGSLEAS